MPIPQNPSIIKLLACLLTLVFSLKPLSLNADDLGENEINAAVTTERMVVQTLSDGSILDQFPFDGIPNVIDSVVSQVGLEGGQFDSRVVIDFDLHVIPDSKVIQSATLVLMPLGKTIAEGDTSLPIEIRGFASNGVLQLNDFHLGGFVSVVDGFPMVPGVRERVDVTRFVRNLFASHQKLIGFVLRTTGRGGFIFGSLGYAHPATLVVRLVDAT
jgi:hypothetical protein